MKRFVILFLFISTSLFAREFSFPDNTPARLEMGKALLSFHLLGAESDHQHFFLPDQGIDVLFRIYRDSGAFYYTFINGENAQKYSLNNKGNFSLKRSKETGAYEYCSWLLKKRSDTFLRIFPEKGRSRMEVVVMDYPLYQNIILPVSFDKVIFYSFNEIASLSRGLVDWDFVLYEKQDDLHRRTEEVVAAMRKELPRLRDADDGSFDETGKAVFIDSGNPQPGVGGLNCSGFAKWVVDRFYYSLEKSFLPLDPLKEKQLEVRGHRWSRPVEDERDPYFGLDWTRNLAAMLYKAENGREPVHPEFFDVRNVTYLSYVEDVGYRAEDLKFILYYLAITRPGTFYLASVNGLFGNDPVLRQHYHVAILFPYISREGDFQAVVMERVRETPLEAFVTRYKGENVHLVALETDLLPDD